MQAHWEEAASLPQEQVGSVKWAENTAPGECAVGLFGPGRAGTASVLPSWGAQPAGWGGGVREDPGEGKRRPGWSPGGGRPCCFSPSSGRRRWGRRHTWRCKGALCICASRGSCGGWNWRGQSVRPVGLGAREGRVLHRAEPCASAGPTRLREGALESVLKGAVPPGGRPG